MNKLLSAGFTRLFKDKIFMLLCAAMFLAGIIIPLITDADFNLDKIFFVYATVIGIVCSIFVSLFVGTEYSDGCIRNKLITGHHRASVYLTNLIIGFVASLILCAANIIPVLIIGSVRLGDFEYGNRVAVIFVAVSLVMTFAYVSIFTLISMLLSNKAYSAVVCIVLAVVLMLAGVMINSRLEEPEFYEGYSYELNGVVYSEEQEPNPNYISGNARKILEVAYDVIPSGQAIQLSSGTIETPYLLMGYSAMIIVISTGLGLVLFKKKDLK